MAKACKVSRSKFKSKDGYLTSYALACGYVEKFKKGEVEASLWKEHGTYQVRVHDFRDRSWGRVCWESYRSLGSAKKAFKKAKSSIKAGRKATCFVTGKR